MNTVDGALLWVRATTARVAQAWRLLTYIERAALLIVGLHMGLLVAIAWDGAEAAHWFNLAGFGVLAPLLVMIVMDAVVMRRVGKDMGAAMIKINTTKPTGAPRVAEVNCKHGDPHRFVYGTTGWEPAGPAVDNRPTPEEVPAP